MYHLNHSRMTGGQTNLIDWSLTICDLTSRNQWIVTTALTIIKEIQWTRSYTERVWWSYRAERQYRIILIDSEFRDQAECIKPHTSVPIWTHCDHEQQNCEINLLKSGENVCGTTGGYEKSLHENQCRFAIHWYKSHHWCCSSSNSRDCWSSE